MIYTGYVKIMRTVEADSEEQAKRKIADIIGDVCFCTIEPCDVELERGKDK